MDTCWPLALRSAIFCLSRPNAFWKAVVGGGFSFTGTTGGGGTAGVAATGSGVVTPAAELLLIDGGGALVGAEPPERLALIRESKPSLPDFEN